MSQSLRVMLQASAKEGVFRYSGLFRVQKQIPRRTQVVPDPSSSFYLQGEVSLDQEIDGKTFKTETRLTYNSPIPWVMEQSLAPSRLPEYKTIAGSRPSQSS
eukprot:GFKZ01011363.1.p1 GENE.GFKZ01011363.1~~GFKZ01011363.1.p1  ORF type:complete len:102 (+),score=3.92 GFKZ01011363.1:336-641(+)